jgi:hypothetical protein
MMEPHHRARKLRAAAACLLEEAPGLPHQPQRQYLVVAEHAERLAAKIMREAEEAARAARRAKEAPCK